MAFTTQRYLINNLVNADNITASSQGAGTIRQPKKTGTGTATMTPTGSYIGASNLLYTVQCDTAGSVDGAATFRWKTSATATGWEASGVSATSSPTSLSNGISVQWSAGTLVMSDKWQFWAFAEYGVAKLFLNDRDSFWKSGDIIINLLDNDDFEDGFTSGVADGWAKYGASQTYADETSEVHGGSHAQKVTCVADGETLGISQADITITSGHEYYLSVWVYSSSARTFSIYHPNLNSGSRKDTSIPATTWTQVEWYTQGTTTGAQYVYFYNTAANSAPADYLIIDDAKFYELAVLDIDLGSAQEITTIALLDFNFSSDAVVILKGNSSESWASPGYEKSDFTVSSDPIIEYDGDTYRYWRWVFQDVDNSDDFYSVGKLYLGTYSELSGIFKNIPWGSTKDNALHVITNRSEAGKANSYVLSRFTAFVTVYKPTRTSGDLTTLNAIWEATFNVTTGQRISFPVHYFYDESTTLHLCRCLTERNPTTYPNYAHYGMSLSWEEEIITREI